jgi:hypothetical protein
VAAGFCRSAALVIAGSAYGAVRHANEVDQLTVDARMPDTDGPRFIIRIVTAEIEIASGVDGEIDEGLKFPRGEIYRQALGHGSEIEDERAKQGNRPIDGIDLNVAVGDAGGWVDRSVNDLPRAVLAIESAQLHGVADGLIKSAAAFRGHGQSKLHRLVQDRADGNGPANAPAELHEFAIRIKSRAGRFHLAKPREGAFDGFGVMVGVV